MKFQGVLRKLGIDRVGFAAILAAAVCSQAGVALAAGPQGGAIGNGKFVSYENKLLKLTLARPESWDQLEVGSGVTFLEPKAEAPTVTDTASIHVDSRKFPEIQSIEDLEHYVRFFLPDYAWQSKSTSGFGGFKGTKGSEGAEYVFRKPGEVLTVLYKSSESDSATTYIETTLGSLELK